jgi:predicted NAD/FAD-binding protein
VQTERRLKIAVIGTGVSGLSAAWLIGRRHDVTLYERDNRLGGHANTVAVPTSRDVVPVDTGFIVYNPPAYPNFTALLEHLRVPSKPSVMSFSVSLDRGRLEYAGTDLAGLFAQRRNLVQPRFWSMLRDIRRFYRDAAVDAAGAHESTTLGQYLQQRGYGEAFRDDHLLPMASAIWSAPAGTLLDYPVRAFVRFFDNHGLLRISGRPVWRTVQGGSRSYVAALAAGIPGTRRMECAACAVTRTASGVSVRDARGGRDEFDQAVIATHADEALALLSDAAADEAELLGAFPYESNIAVLHSDAGLMPRRRATWSSWNYCGETERLSVTYWMNSLQGIGQETPFFVTLNPLRPPRDETVIESQTYTHPVFNARALAAQRRLWSLQGRRNTWFCGAYFGSGFHEDGLQAGLAVGEALSGETRPWKVQSPSDRIHLAPAVAAGL